MTDYGEEILRVAQDDRVCERDYRVGHALLAMTERAPRNDGERLPRRARPPRNGGATKKSADLAGRHSRLLNRTITTY